MSKFSIPLLLTLLFLTTIFPVHNALSCSTSCNYGNCVSENKCACEFGYFSSIAPCDTKVSPLYNQRYIQKVIPGNSWDYSYIPLSHVISDVELQFQAVQGSADAYIMLQPSDSYNLPTDQDDSVLISPTNTVDNTLSYQITKEEVWATNGGWLTIAFHNDGPLKARVRVQYVAITNQKVIYDDSDNSDDGSSGALKKTGTALGFIIFGIVLCFAIYVRIKIGRISLGPQQRVHLQVNPQNSRQNNEFIVVMDPSPQNNQNARAHGNRPFQVGNDTPQGQVFAEKINLTKEEIQKYFPKREFSQLKMPFPQTACSICLDDFKPEIICHQLYCFHIFHEACIEEWLVKNDSCPDCRKPITKQAIKKFLKEQRKLKNVQEGQSVEQNQISRSVYLHH